MFVIHPSLKDLPAEEVCRYAGLHGSSDNFPGNLIHDAIMHCQLLSHPAAICQLFPLSVHPDTIMIGQTIFKSRDLSQHLHQATYAALIVATIGSEVEQASTILFGQNSYAAGLLLDAAGDTAVELIANIACKHLTSQFQTLGYTPTTRFSPGYGDWPLTEQALLLSIANADRIGVKCNDSSLLIPRKSISAIVGLVPSIESSELKPIKNCQNNCSCCSFKNCFCRRI